MKYTFWIGVVAYVKLVVKSVLCNRYVLGEVETDVVFLEHAADGEDRETGRGSPWYAHEE